MKKSIWKSARSNRFWRNPEEIPEGWLKVLFAIAPERMPDLIAYFAAQNWDCADFVQSEARFYEMLPKGATKGSALAAIPDAVRRRKLENYRQQGTLTMTWKCSVPLTSAPARQMHSLV